MPLTETQKAAKKRKKARRKERKRAEHIASEVQYATSYKGTLHQHLKDWNGD